MLPLDYVDWLSVSLIVRDRHQETGFGLAMRNFLPASSSSLATALAACLPVVVSMAARSVLSQAIDW